MHRTIQCLFAAVAAQHVDLFILRATLKMREASQVVPAEHRPDPTDTTNTAAMAVADLLHGPGPERTDRQRH